MTAKCLYLIFISSELTHIAGKTIKNKKYQLITHLFINIYKKIKLYSANIQYVAFYEKSIFEMCSPLSR